MTICPACEEKMAASESCLVDEIELEDGTVQRRIPYGEERYFVAAPEAPEDRTCHDCGVAVGEMHHGYCDFEACARCGTQKLACSCGTSEETAELGHCVDHGPVPLVIHRPIALKNDEAGLDPDRDDAVDRLQTLCEQCHGLTDLAAQLGR
jgi:hypothetical protein